MVPHPGSDPVYWTVAGIALQQETPPEADPIGRIAEQSGNRGRCDLLRSQRTVAGLPPPGAPNFANMCLDLDLDELGFITPVLHVGCAAPRVRDGCPSGGRPDGASALPTARPAGQRLPTSFDDMKPHSLGAGV